jgi:hypothetical protein
MHGRAHIKYPAGCPQVMQIQPFGSNDDIKNQWDNEEIYTMLVHVLQKSENTHITGK